MRRAKRSCLEGMRLRNGRLGLPFRWEIMSRIDIIEEPALDVGEVTAKLLARGAVHDISEIEAYF